MPALNLKVFFEAVDKMSGPMKRIGLAFDGMDKAAKASARTIKNWGAVSAVAFGAFQGSKHLSDAMNRVNQAAEPLAEAKTHFEQVAGAANTAKAGVQAAALARAYGQASWQEEIETLRRAYQLYGNYQDAVKAAAAANKLATATNQDVRETLDQIAISARNAGVPVQVMADKLAALYKVSGNATDSPTGLRQLERGYSLAKTQGVSLDKFLAIAALVQKHEGKGATRDLFTYFEQTTKKGGGLHLSQRSLAVHNLIQSHAKELAAAESALKNSHGVSEQILKKALLDPARQNKIAREKAALLAQGFGAAALPAQAKMNSLIGDIEGWGAKLEIAHPAVTAALSDAALFGSKLVHLGSAAAGAVISIHALSAAISALRLASGAEAAAGGAAEGTTIAAGATAATVGTVGVDAAGGAAWVYYMQYKLPNAIGEAIGNKLKEAIGELLRAEKRHDQETHVHVKLDGHEIAHAVAKHNGVKSRTAF